MFTVDVKQQCNYATIPRHFCCFYYPALEQQIIRLTGRAYVVFITTLYSSVVSTDHCYFDYHLNSLYISLVLQSARFNFLWERRWVVQVYSCISMLCLLLFQLFFVISSLRFDTLNVRVVSEAEESYFHVGVTSVV